MSADELILFRGCTCAYTQPETEKLIGQVLKKVAQPFRVLEKEPCCGGELFRYGAISQAKKKVEQTIAYFREQGVKKILTYCPECYITFKFDFPEIVPDLGFEILHFTELMADLLKSEKIKFEKEVPIDNNVTYFDGCHLGREAGLYEAPRYILQQIPGLKYKEMPLAQRFAMCCGGPIRIPHVELRNRMTTRTLKEARKKAKVKKDGGIIVACPTCYFNFKAVAEIQESKVKPISLIHLIAYELGITDSWKENGKEEE